MSKSNRIDSLDSLRGIASLIVVIFHCLISFPVFNVANYKFQYANNFIKIFTITPIHTLWAGNEAVLLFFILSGFVLSIPFLNKKEFNYLNYVVKRFFRIYMPYIILMLLSSLLVVWFSDYQNHISMSQSYNNRWGHPVTLKAIISYLIMFNYDISNVNGVVWTLFHEMRISLLFPLIILTILKFNLKKAVVITFSSNILLYYITGIFFKLPFGLLSDYIGSFQETFYYTTFFIFGGFLSRYKNEVGTRVANLNHIKKYILLLISLFLINNRWLNIINLKNSQIKDLIAALGILLLFSLVLNSKKLESSLIKRPFIFLGKISYSLYLVHIPVLMMLSIYLSKSIPIVWTFLFVPIVAIIVAYFSNKYIEEPCIKLGKKLSISIKEIDIQLKITIFQKIQHKKNL